MDLIKTECSYRYSAQELKIIEAFIDQSDAAELETHLKERQSLMAALEKLQAKAETAYNEKDRAALQAALNSQEIYTGKIQDADEEIGAVFASIEDKYTKSLKGDESRILKDLRAMLAPISKQDYLNTVKKRRELQAVLSEQTGGELPRGAHFKPSAKDAWGYLWSFCRLQINALIFYQIPKGEAERLVKEKLYTFYPKAREREAAQYFPTPPKSDGIMGLLPITPAFISFMGANSRFTPAEMTRDGKETVKLDGLDIIANAGEYNLTTSAQKLFVKILDVLCTNNTYKDPSSINPTVVFSVKEYAKEKNTPQTEASLKKLRKQIKADVSALYNLSLTIPLPDGSDTIKTRILIAENDPIQSGAVKVMINPLLSKYFMQYGFLTPYDIRILGTDERNPNIMAFYLKMAAHAGNNGNIKRGTADILKVENLLKSAASIPTYEQVKATSRAVDRKIIEPFEKTLNYLQDHNLIQWEYCGAKKAPLSDAELNDNSYTAFAKRYIRFTVTGTPQTPRISKENERKRRAYKKRKSATR